MERFDSVIFITPNIGEYDKNNLFIKTLNSDEIKFLEDPVFEYRKKHDSYQSCMKDIKDKMTKIKKILEE